MRTCTCCHQRRHTGDFYRHPPWRNRKARLDSWCKPCRRRDITARYQHATGGGRVDAAATRARLVWLAEQDTSRRRVAAQVGISPETIRNVTARGQPTVTRRVAVAVEQLTRTVAADRRRRYREHAA